MAELAALPHRHQGVLALAILAGLRAGEIRCLRRENIDLIHATMRVYGKGRKSRDVHIVPALASLLAALLRPCGHCGHVERGLLLPGTRGGMMSHNQPWMIAQHYAGAGAHQLRGTFVTTCLEQGVPLHVLQAQLGHEAAQTTLGYASRRPEVLERALDGVSFGA